jgi:hypothetical protein
VPTNHSHDQHHYWGLDLFGGVHLLFVNPIVNFFGIAAFFAQAHVFMRRMPGSECSVLSLVGLAAQGATFALLVPSWLRRLSFPWNEVNGGWLGLGDAKSIVSDG